MEILIRVTGYYNSVLAYGEEKAIRNASDAGASGFIIVDLPPEEASIFRELCAEVKCVFAGIVCAAMEANRAGLQALLCSAYCAIHFYAACQIPILHC